MTTKRCLKRCAPVRTAICSRTPARMNCWRPRRTRALFHLKRIVDIDPRHSLVAGIIWLVVALATSFAIAASLWAGNVAREIVVQQHVRRLALETDELASDLSQAASMRLAAIRAMQTEGSPAEVF